MERVTLQVRRIAPAAQGFGEPGTAMLAGHAGS